MEGVVLIPNRAEYDRRVYTDTEGQGTDHTDLPRLTPGSDGEQASTPPPDAPRSGAAAPVDLGLLDDLTTGLSEVQAALERLDSGTYGLCEHCGDSIDDSALESSPTAVLCEAHLPFGQIPHSGSEASQ
jgi:RNA polymerase-binding transcription factor DksA